MDDDTLEMDICDMCGGTGEVESMDDVYAGEPHVAPIGMISCPECRFRNEDDDQN